MRAWLAVGVGAVLMVSAACGGIIDPSENDITELTGTLQVNDESEHQFSVDRNGEFSIRLTALTPDANAVVGVAFGDLIGGGCAYSPFYTNNFATLNRTALTGPINRGTFCVAVFDVGTLTTAQTYTLQVSHP